MYRIGEKFYLFLFLHGAFVTDFIVETKHSWPTNIHACALDLTYINIVDRKNNIPMT